MDSRKENSITYYGQIIANLQRLLEVARIHPRLAMVGIESELEIIIREILPRNVLQKLIEDILDSDNNGDPRYPETTAIRRTLKSFATLHIVTEAIGEKLLQIIKKGGECRHSRVAVRLTDVEMAVHNATMFIDSLKVIGCANLFSCPKHNWHSDFVFADILGLPAGEPYINACPECYKEWELKNERERQSPEYICKEKVTASGKILKAIKKLPSRPPIIYWEIPNPDESSKDVNNKRRR